METLTNQQVWTVDTVHSNLKFQVAHLVISEVEGEFTSYQGQITADENFENLNVQFEIDVNSINTNNEMRDGHLKSDDFFNAEQFPKIKFSSTHATKTSDKNFKIVGNLTIRDITKQVELFATYNGIAQDPYGNTKAGFKVTTEINRFDFNLKWSALTEAGGMVVGQDISIKANIQLQKN